MMLVYAFTILIVTLWFARMIADQKIIWKSTRVGWFMLAFVVSQILSTIFSIHPFTSWFGYYSRFHGGLLSTFSYALLYFAAVNNLDRRDWLPLVKTIMVSTLLVSLYALPEKFGVSFSCVIFRGEWNTACWQEATNPRYRIFGSFGQPNWLAAYLITTLPLSVWWIGRWWQNIYSTYTTKKWQLTPIIKQLTGFDVLAWLTVLLGTLALLYTNSRSGMLGLGVGLIFFSAILFFDWLGNKKKTTFFKQVQLLLPAAIIIGTLVLFIGTPVTPSLPQLLQKWQSPSPSSGEASSAAQIDVSIPSGTVLQTGGTESGTIRRIVWQGALDIWRRYPILGSGVETFAYSYYQSRPVEHNYVSEWDFLYNKAHNEFLNFLATTGIVGLTSYVLLLLATSWQLWQHRLKSKDSHYFSLALLSGYLALAVSNFFGFSTVMLGVLLFIYPALDTMARQKASKKSLASDSWLAWSRLDSKQKLATIILMIVYLFALHRVWFWWNNDRLLARSQTEAASGQSWQAYQTLAQLTSRAPYQAKYWEQRALLTAQLAVSTYSSNEATAAAQLTSDAILSADLAVETNPVHLNMWKSRAKVFIWLSAINEAYLDDAIKALENAKTLAPTNPKIWYNLALIYQSNDQNEPADAAFQQAITLKPNYEQARSSYAEFLTAQKQYQAALEQYQYINDVLKPQEDLYQDEIEALQKEQDSSKSDS